MDSFHFLCFLFIVRVSGKEQTPAGSSSLVNKVEAEMVLCVYQQLMRHFPDLIKRPATAVITPYKAQVHFPH